MATAVCLDSLMEPTNGQIFEALIDFRDGIAENFARVHAKLEEHDRRFDEHDRRFDTLERRMGRLETRVEDVEVRLGRVEGAVGKLERRLSA